MIAILIISIVAASLVASYVVVCNKFLRQDEHYADDTAAPAPKESEPAYHGTPARA